MATSLGVSAEVRNTLAVPFSIGRCSCVDIKQSTWTASVVACLVFFGGWFSIRPVLIYNETWNVMSGVVQKVVSVHRASNLSFVRQKPKFNRLLYKIGLNLWWVKVYFCCFWEVVMMFDRSSILISIFKSIKVVS